MTTPLRWAALALFILALGLPTAPAPADEEIPWTVQADPWPFPAAAPKAGKKVFDVPDRHEVRFPETPSPFFAIVAQDDKKGTKVQFHDLRTLQPVGKAVESDKIDARNMRLSPHGDLILSIDAKAEKPTVTVVSTGGQPVVGAIAINDTKTKIEGMDFAGKDRVLTVKEIREDNKPKRYWQVWDVKTGKEVSRIQTQLEYSPKWATVTPGGRYLVIQETSGNGYYLHFWDLTTGAKAGKIALQDKAEPWGQCAALAISPDGKELALTWRVEKDGVVLRLMRFDLEKGVKIGEHKLLADAKPSSPGLLAGRFKTLQYLPDGRAWLLSGHQVVERETGAVVSKIDPAPKFNGDTRDRRFLDAYHVTDVKDRKLTVLELPKADLDAAIAKARAPK